MAILRDWEFLSTQLKLLKRQIRKGTIIFLKGDDKEGEKPVTKPWEKGLCEQLRKDYYPWALCLCVMSKLWHRLTT